MNKKEKRVVYIDLTDFRYELEGALGGNSVYSTVEDLKENTLCWDTCGIVKCDIVLKEIVVKENWDQSKFTKYSKEEFKKNPKLQILETRLAHLKFLEDKVKKQKLKIKEIKKDLKNERK